MPESIEGFGGGNTSVPPSPTSGSSDGGDGGSSPDGRHHDDPKHRPNSASAQKHAKQPVAATPKEQTHPQERSGTIPRDARDASRPQTTSLGQTGHPSPRRFDLPARGRPSTRPGHEHLITINASVGHSVTHDSSWKSYGANLMVRTSVEIAARLKVSGHREGRLVVSPIGRGSVSVRADHFEATADHLYGAASRISKAELRKLITNANKYQGTPQTGTVKLGGKHGYREHILAGKASGSVPIRNGHLAVTFTVKKGVLQISIELSVEEKVKLKRGPMVTLTTSITHTVSVASKPSEKSHTPTRVPIVVIEEIVGGALTVGALVVALRAVPSGAAPEDGGGAGEGDFQGGGGIRQRVD